MDGAAGILVIVLSVVLAIFLLLAIVLTILLIKITKQIKDVTSSAQRTTHMLESAAANVSRFTTPLMIVKAFKGQFKKSKTKK